MNKIKTVSERVSKWVSERWATLAAALILTYSLTHLLTYSQAAEATRLNIETTDSGLVGGRKINTNFMTLWTNSILSNITDRGSSSVASNLTVGLTNTMGYFRLTNAPTANYALISDANGFGTWGMLPAGNSEITNANVLHVRKDGNDSTAMRGRSDKPWLTPGLAISNAQNNDIVLIGPGSYTMRGFGTTNSATLAAFLSDCPTPIYLKTNLTILGQGYPVLNCTNAGVIMPIVSCSNITIQGIQFSVSTNQLTNGVYSFAAVEMRGSNDLVTIRDCKFIDIANQAITAWYRPNDTRELRVQDCYFKNIGQSNYVTLGQPDGACISGNSQKLLVTGNYARDIWGWGFVEIDHQNTVGPASSYTNGPFIIANNICNGLYQYGVTIGRIATFDSIPPDDVLITGNTFSRAFQHDPVNTPVLVAINNGRNVVVQNNIFSDPAEYPIVGTTSVGVGINAAAAGGPTNVLVANNYFNGMGSGIYVYTNASKKAFNLVFKGNIFNNMAYSPLAGYMNNISILDNHWTGDIRHGGALGDYPFINLFASPTNLFIAHNIINVAPGSRDYAGHFIDMRDQDGQTNRADNLTMIGNMNLDPNSIGIDGGNFNLTNRWNTKYGPQSHETRYVTGADNVLFSDRTLIITQGISTATAGVKLMGASTNTGKIVCMIFNVTNQVYVTSASGTIDGYTAFTNQNRLGAITFQSDGANWYVAASDARLSQSYGENMRGVAYIGDSAYVSGRTQVVHPTARGTYRGLEMLDNGIAVLDGSAANANYLMHKGTNTLQWSQAGVVISTNLTSPGLTNRFKVDGSATVTETNYAGSLVTSGGLHLFTNSPPAAPLNGGASFMWNSNGTIFLLTSAPFTATWGATNKLGP